MAKIYFCPGAGTNSNIVASHTFTEYRCGAFMTVLLMIAILLLILYTILIIYYRQAWVSIPGFNSAAAGTTTVTIIIPARNEEANIGACLSSLISQSYSTDLFEVIVVDDHSTDETAAIVKSFSPNIRLISLKDHLNEEINSYKKKAIEIAIAESKGELLMTTDADCIVSKDWIKTIVNFYEQQQPAFIAAPVVIDCSNRFIEIFQSLDFMTLQGITGAAVHKKLHNMCNGANLAYTRAAFIDVDGFAGIDNIASGDDMLLMHKISIKHPGKLFFLKSKQAIVKTKPVKTIRGFFNQRIRWASKADKYQDKSLFPVLLLVYLFNLIMFVLPVLSVFIAEKYSIFNVQYTVFEFWLLLLALKTAIELIFLIPVAEFFGKQKLLWWFPLMQPFHILYTVIAGFLGKFGTYQWKNRTVK